jgi:hypothetical protein
MNMSQAEDAGFDTGVEHTFIGGGQTGRIENRKKINNY